MIKRAYMICSNEDSLKTERDYLRNTFTRINNYPQKLVEATMNRIKEEINAPQTTENSNNDDQESTPTTLMIKVPFAGDKGEGLLKDLGRSLQTNLPTDIKCRIVRTGTKLQKNFNIKDKMEDQHRSNFIYHYECRNKRCKECYTGETGRREGERTLEHAGRDKKSWIHIHSLKSKHPKAQRSDFKVLATNYEDRTKRRIAEAMFICDLKPTLNKKEGKL